MPVLAIVGGQDAILDSYGTKRRLESCAGRFGVLVAGMRTSAPGPKRPHSRLPERRVKPATPGRGRLNASLLFHFGDDSFRLFHPNRKAAAHFQLRHRNREAGRDHAVLGGTGRDTVADN
jgi:hypothetical protein